MGLFDNLTTCKKPFNEKYEWELASSPLGMSSFEWIGNEVPLGWTAGACKDWMNRMWSIKRNGSIVHSGNYYRHPTSGDTYWTYFGAPEGAAVNAPSAESFVAQAVADGFVFLGVQDDPQPDPEPDPEPKPTKPDIAGIGWLLGILGAGALVTVLVVKLKGKKGRRYERKS